jgi:hypothetical protein
MMSEAEGTCNLNACRIGHPMSNTINAFVPGRRITIEAAPQGPLHGLTLAAKDLFRCRGPSDRRRQS